MGGKFDAISIQALVESIGIPVTIADPFDVVETKDLIHELIHRPGIQVLILRQPCATLASKTRAKKTVRVDPDKCRGDSCGCGKYCSRVWGCPGNSWDFTSGKAVIDEVVCVGCGVCAKLCPAGAIIVEGGAEE